MPPPALVVSTVLVGGKSAPAAAGARGVTLDGTGGSLEFRFAALALAAPGRVRYRWRLDGLDDGWTAPRSAGRASYPRLSPGSYRFEVVASDAGGGWTAGPVSVAVRIRAPWYAAWWFRLLGLTVAGLAVAWGLRTRARALDRRRGVLESLAAERTVELAEANDKIVEQNRLLAELSRTDPLTGLANRRVLEEMLPVEMAVLRREVAATPRGVPLSPRGLVVFVLDLDHFKDVNDRHGHDMGDTYLRVVADALRRVLREIDMAIRWGGEELVVIGRALDRLGTVALARRLMEVIAAAELEGRDGAAIRATVSVGFCPYPLAGSGMVGSGSWGRLVQVADRLMYEAKRRGRARACGLVYAPGPRRGIDEREVLERLLADPAAPAPGLEFVELDPENDAVTGARTWHPRT